MRHDNMTHWGWNLSIIFFISNNSLNAFFSQKIFLS